MSEMPNGEIYHFMKGSKLRTKLLIVALVLLVIVPPASYYYYKFAIFRPAGLYEDLDFEIKSGDSVTDIASNLYTSNAINSEFLFSVYLYINGLDKNIQAGTYKIRPGVTVVDLAAMFQHGINDQKITFLEGWRIEEFARLASLNFNKINYTKFLELASGHEGYLFPDTYTFNKDVTEEEMFATLFETFEAKTKELLSSEKIKRTGLSKDQVIILASIIERESSNEEDRPIIAGILLKRFREGARIDADATVQYAVALSKLCPQTKSGVCAPVLEDVYKFDWWDSDITVEDLASDSPYNTRKHIGLPPMPISSVSVSAIESVINYKDSEFYYYLNDIRGNTYYAKTLEEHNANIAKYLVN